MYDPNKIVKELSVETPFIPGLDLYPVDQFGFVDVRKAFDQGSVDGNVSIRDEHFNGVLDPDDLMNRPLDQFEALRQANFVRESLKAAKAQAEQVTTSGDTK